MSNSWYLDNLVLFHFENTEGVTRNPLTLYLLFLSDITVERMSGSDKSKSIMWRCIGVEVMGRKRTRAWSRTMARTMSGELHWDWGWL